MRGETYQACSRALSSACTEKDVSLPGLLKKCVFELQDTTPFRNRVFTLFANTASVGWISQKSADLQFGAEYSILAMVEEVVSRTKPYSIVDHSSDGVRALGPSIRKSLVVSLENRAPLALIRQVAAWCGFPSNCEVTQYIFEEIQCACSELLQWMNDNHTVVSELQNIANASSDLTMTRQQLVAFVHDCKVPLNSLYDQCRRTESRRPLLPDLNYLKNLVQSLGSGRFLNDLSHKRVTSLDVLLLRVLSRCSTYGLEHKIILGKDLPRTVYTSLAIRGGCEIALERILTNLVDNGVKYSGDAPIQIVVSRLVDTIVMRIEDLGKGFSPEQLHSLREGATLSSASPKGWGVGINNTISAVKRMNGGIEFGATDTGGGLVTVTLPGSVIYSENSLGGESCNDHHSEVFELPRRYALLIDDDIEQGRSLQRALSAEGILCEIVVTVEDALLKIDTELPEAVICDAHMPDGGARAFLSRVRGVERAWRFAVMSGDESDRVVYDLASRGAEEFFTKPIDVAQIVAWYTKELGQNSLESSEKPFFRTNSLPAA